MNQKCSVAPEGESIFKDKLLAFVLNGVTLVEYFQINFGKYFFIMEAFKSCYSDAKISSRQTTGDTKSVYHMTPVGSQSGPPFIFSPV